MQRGFQAQQQRHDDGACGGELPALRDRQAAENKGQQHGDLGGHAMVAAATRIDQIAGNDQQREHGEHGHPGGAAEMADANCRETAEQARQAEGADPGDQLLAGAVSAAPATFGADQ